MWWPVLPLALGVILCCAGCASPGQIGETQPADSVPEATGQLPAGRLPPLPVDRAASDVFMQCINGSDTYARSSNATNDGTKLILSPTGHEISWGIWRFPPKLDELIEFKALIVQLSEWGGSSAYVGVADYETGVWDFVECPGDGYIPVDADHYVSPAGYWYFAIVAYSGEQVDVHTLHLSIEDTWVIAKSIGGYIPMASERSSMAEVDGLPAMSYTYDASRLFYRRATDPAAGEWGTAQSLEEGWVYCKSSSLACVAGNPAICYVAHDSPLWQLKYIRATDAAGSAWGGPQVVDTLDGAGGQVSMAVVADNPAISYHDKANGDLLYIRANDATGSTWGARVTVDAGGGTGDTDLHSSLAVVAHRPAISYYDLSATALRYVRASDETGSAWGSSAILDGAGVVDVGQYTTLVELRNGPAISYHDATNSTLKFIRASSVTGSSWNSPQNIADGGAFASMAILSDFPAIAYINEGHLMYIEAFYMSGTEWRPPRLLDWSTPGSVGPFKACSLANVCDRPAICYCEWESFSLWAAFSPGL